MKRTDAFLSVLAVAALLLGSAGAASAATPGYAVYNVQVSYMGVSHGFTVNESVSATHDVNFDTLILTIVSGNSTFSYSRSINSSLDVSPFLPSITNQSFSYKSGSSTATLSIMKNGSAPVQFNGGSYSLTSYSVKAIVTSNGTTTSTSASLLTFPSGLVYSVKDSVSVPNLQGLPALGTGSLVLPGLGSTSLGSIGLGSSSILSLGAGASGNLVLSINLLSTSLPLTGPSPTLSAQAASIGIGAGAVISVLALGLGVRFRHRHQADTTPRPEYSVD